MQTLLQILGLGRGRLQSFFVVAVMVSAGTGATLCEPWIYRASSECRVLVLSRRKDRTGRDAGRPHDPGRILPGQDVSR